VVLGVGILIYIALRMPIANGMGWGPTVLFAFTPLWFQPGMWTLIMLLLPCMVIGYTIGNHLHLRLSVATLRGGIAWLLLANGVLLILRATGAMS